MVLHLYLCGLTHMDSLSLLPRHPLPLVTHHPLLYHVCHCQFIKKNVCHCHALSNLLLIQNINFFFDELIQNIHKTNWETIYNCINSYLILPVDYAYTLKSSIYLLSFFLLFFLVNIYLLSFVHLKSTLVLSLCLSLTHNFSFNLQHKKTRETEKKIRTKYIKHIGLRFCVYL